MNVSNGISEIIYKSSLGNGTVLKTAYIWPSYNTGIVDKIQGSAKPDQVFSSSVSPALNNYSHPLTKVSIEIDEYNSSKTLTNRNSAYFPGMFFDARA